MLKFQHARAMAVSLITSGPDPLQDSITYMAFAAEDIPAVTLDCRALTMEESRCLRTLFTLDATKVFLRAQNDLQFLSALHIFPGSVFDVSLAHGLLSMENTADGPTMDALCGIYLGNRYTNPGTLAGHQSLELIAEHKKLAADLVSLRKAMIPLLLRHNLVAVAEIEFSCVKALARLQYHGIYLNLDRWQILHERAQAEKEQALQALYAFTGKPALQQTLWGPAESRGPNFDSNPYVLKLLRQHDINVSSTAKQELYEHRKHPLVQALMKYRKAGKAISAFLQPLPGMLHPKTKRLHPQYGQLTAPSGRMSCANPNIQQIPRDPAFRECFNAPPDKSLIVADYSQIELRVAAQIARDERMLAAYQRGDDLHLLTASYLAGKPVDLVSKQERQAYKAVNLGLIYGMGAVGLQQTAQQTYGVDMPMEDAIRFRESFFKTYHGIARWHKELRTADAAVGRTLSGRRIPYRDNAGLPEKSNLPVQGTAADIIKKALGLLADRLENDVWIVAVIHDEILLECPTPKAEATARLLQTTMEEAANGILPDVPTTVEAKISASWAEK